MSTNNKPQNKIIIHIGYPKTGTTFFQENFYPYVKNHKYINRELIREKIIRPHVFNFNQNDTKKNFEENYNYNIIICEEELIVDKRVNGSIIKEKAERLSNVFPEAEIVIFIRNQVDMMASRYLEYIKTGGTYSINKYLYKKKNPISNNNKTQNKLIDHHRKKSPIDFTSFEYDKLIDLYSTYFPKDKIHVFIYEEFANNNNTFLSNFSEKFSFKIDLKKINPSKKNIKYKGIIIRLARFTNIFTKHRFNNKYYLIHIPLWYNVSHIVYKKLNNLKIFRKSTSEKILGKRNVSIIKEYFKESNQNLIKKYDLKNIKIYNYPL